MSLNRREFLEQAAAASALLAVPGFMTACVRNGTGLMPPTGEAVFGSTWFAHAFGIEEGTIRRVMERALSRGGEYCDLYFEHSLSNDLRLSDGIVNFARSDVSLGVGIRVVQGIRTGYAFTEELTLESMLQAADTASAIANSNPSAQVKPFGVVHPPSYYPVQVGWEAVGIDRKMPWMVRANDRVMKKDPRIIKANIFFRDQAKRILIATSEGLVVEDYQPSGMINIYCVAEQNGRRETSGFDLATRDDADFFTDERIDHAADEAVRRTLTLLEAVKAPAGELPLVLGPGASGILLHEAIGHGIEADFNRKNISIFSDKIGKRVAIPEVTVVDSGIHKHVRGSINVDDEGNFGQETVLVEQGVLKTYLHDRMTSKAMNVAATGSGRRESFKFAPMPRMRNTYMLPGQHTAEDIIKTVKRGIYAETFKNGQVTIGEGSFSFFIALGYLIENGKKVAPIKDVNLIGNGPEVLSRITLVGNDLQLDVGGWTCGKNGQMVPVGQGMPTTLVSSITVGGA